MPLDEGSNNITATATDTEGNTAKATVTVTAVTTTPHVTLRANIESGIAPLETYFSVSTSIPNAVATYEMDFKGDGMDVDDYTGTTFDNISFTYDTEGIYYPTVTVTDTQSNTYTDTIAIVVLNVTDIETLLENIWEAMKTALMAGDIDTALTYFVDENKDRYNDTFTDLGSEELNAILSSIEGFELYTYYEQMAQCRLLRVENSGTFAYPITFIQDGDGIWKIYGY